MAAVDEFSSQRVFSSLTPSERDRLATTAGEAHFDDGERIFSAGEPANGCWIIRSGQVALDTPVPNRGDMVIQTVGRGDLLGWSWFVPPRSWHFGATAVGPVETWTLDTRELLSMAEQDPHFGYALAQALFNALLDRLQATRARLLDLYGNPMRLSAADR